MGDDYTCVLYRSGEVTCYGSINSIPYDGEFPNYGGETEVCALQEHNILCWDALGEVGGNIFASGLEVSYYDVSWSTMQDFSLFPSYQSDIFTTTIVDASDSDGIFDSGKSDYVAVLFEGFLYIDTASPYTFQLESDDGSMLYINDELVIDNDGLHGLSSSMVPFLCQKAFIKYDWNILRPMVVVVLLFDGWMVTLLFLFLQTSFIMEYLDHLSQIYPLAQIILAIFSC